MIGTSGFSFEDWRGTVYPEHLKKADWLSYYEHELMFNTLEVNFTYYTLPSPRTMEGMSRKTSESFLFVVKAFRGMTHEFKKNSSTAQKKLFGEFLHGLNPLITAGKLGAVLAQFPYSFYPTRDNLNYLQRFRDLIGDIPLTVEFRNKSWLQVATFQFLREHLMGYCIVDEPKLPQLMPFHPEATSSIGYFRMHGRNRRWFNVPTAVRYDYLYSLEELAEFLSPIKMIATVTEKAFVFFNNCHAGSAVKNAAQLLRMLKKSSKK